ncbi:hypothetical protein [Algoriphagus terrigena]|uniref:hypothetical protein n=1 Tax=Algoriphagus terrigena TaxID=344884 RepID=UPI00040388CB|nr:hypothetical protein [Algoriphagus terrigena]
MSTDNLVSVDIPDGEIAQVLAALTTASDILMKYLIALTPEQRANMLKLGDASVAFASKAMEYLKSSPTFLPATVSAVEMEKDWKVFNQLMPVIHLLDKLYSGVSDTSMEAGSELYKNCLLYYTGAKIGAEMNYPGAKPISEDLGKRFKGQGRRNGPPPTE